MESSFGGMSSSNSLSVVPPSGLHGSNNRTVDTNEETSSSLLSSKISSSSPCNTNDNINSRFAAMGLTSSPPNTDGSNILTRPTSISRTTYHLTSPNLYAPRDGKTMTEYLESLEGREPPRPRHRQWSKYMSNPLIIPSYMRGSEREPISEWLETNGVDTSYRYRKLGNKRDAAGFSEDSEEYNASKRHRHVPGTAHATETAASEDSASDNGASPADGFDSDDASSSADDDDRSLPLLDENEIGKSSELLTDDNSVDHADDASFGGNVESDGDSGNEVEEGEADGSVVLHNDGCVYYDEEPLPSLELAKRMGFNLEQLQKKVPLLYKGLQAFDKTNFPLGVRKSSHVSSGEADGHHDCRMDNDTTVCYVCAEGEGGELRYIDFDPFV